MAIRRVYKYPVPTAHMVPVSMPKSAEILSVQVQHGQPCIWALVNPDEPNVDRWFRLAGTGHDIEWKAGMAHRGTFQVQDGSLVFHLFECKP